MKETVTESAGPGAKRKRRTALQVFMDHKNEHVANVAKCEEAIVQASANLEEARAKQSEFLTEARAALGV